MRRLSLKSTDFGVDPILFKEFFLANSQEKGKRFAALFSPAAFPANTMPELTTSIPPAKWVIKRVKISNKTLRIN